VIQSSSDQRDPRTFNPQHGDFETWGTALKEHTFEVAETARQALLRNNRVFCMAPVPLS